MINYFKLLQQVLIKKDVAYNFGTNEMWNEFQNKEGIVFPQDYKSIINYYGTGGIGNFLWILTPFELDKNVNYKYRMNMILEAYIESKNKFPNDFQYEVFPNKNGLLPWGYTDNGDELFWKMKGNVNNWEIIVYESRSPIFYSYKMGLAEFLFKLISNEIKCDIFPEGILEQRMEYTAVKI